ncbi:MAG TPA: FlgD immunoglobulin-like domain containing protein, partial [Candidatus Krumholzibacterium sp.]|nr:FlgD immunoglobulin-like domain containing protein [Candidatus Krumholzibacterium sp.]
FVWTDNRTGTPRVYIQHLDGDGVATWAAGGIPVSSTVDYQGSPVITTDGEGGMIVAWSDMRTGDFDIYAQRFDIDGNALWITDGNLVCGEIDNQLYPKIVSNGNRHGAIIAWEDERGSSTDIYAQNLYSDGAPAWTADGVAVCAASGLQYNISIVEDAWSYCFITWVDMRTGYGIYAQYLDDLSSPQWTWDGKAIATGMSGMYDPKIAAIGNGHAMVTWEDARGTDRDIYIQVVDRFGTDRLTANGIPLDTDNGADNEPRIVSPRDGTAVIAWWNQGGWSYDIYAQKVDYDGNQLWAPGGVLLSDALGDQYSHDIKLDGEGGIIAVYQTRPYNYTQIHAQRLDATGARIWPHDGIMVAADPENNLTLYSLGLSMDVTDGPGAIVTWYNFEPLNYDIFAQKLEKHGYWGDPAPVIREVRDVPGDQGGVVNLAWDACRADNDDRHLCTHYTVWRAIGLEQAMLLKESGRPVVSSAAELPRVPEIGTIREGLLGASTYYWKLISTIDAYYLDSYGEICETLFDSTEVSSEYHYFQVIAHTDDPADFWTSAPDSGYSVDNLAPAAPLGVAAEQSFQPEGLLITWSSNRETDLSGYRVYRGLSADFVPGDENLVSSTPDTMLLDSGWDWDTAWYYKLSAVDVHGNESGYAFVSPSEVTGDDAPDLPLASYLSQNYPNPFNPATTVEFGLSRDSRVSLKIFDTTGRLVRVVVDESRPAGHYKEIWDGLNSRGLPVSSGIYYYRLAAADYERTRKMILLR